ncbi:MAG: hypothetical protein QOH89_2415 [Pseudonocardiales bacterium]|nr:hypothetical protein [Pseudonocardiales bacterium]
MELDYLGHLERDSARFAAALRDADPQAPVPSCPEWTADDLLWHVGEVFLFWGTIVRERLADPSAAEEAKPERPGSRAPLVDLFERSRTQLLETLRDTPPQVAAWTWSTDNTTGFVRRRMAHEALIHRLDAELTAGAVTNLDADLASDGVLEVLQHFHGYPDWADWALDGPVGRLRATDTGGEWLVQLGSFSGLSPNSGKTWDHEPSLELIGSGSPTFTLSASARDLDAWLWGRPQLSEPVVDGDPTDHERLRAIVAAGID